MIQLRKLSLCVIVALLYNTVIYAQNSPDSVYIYLPAQTSGSEGQVVNIPIKVRQFKNITSAQFGMQWDSTVARFVGVNSFGISGMTQAAHFGYLATAPDILRFAWYDNNLLPQNMVDDKILFNLQLKLVGKKGKSCNIAFVSDNLTSFEFQDKDSKDMKFGLSNGLLNINASIATKERPVAAKVKIQNPTPNPFQEETSIKMEIAENQIITLEIFDLTGKKIYQEKNEFEIGTHFVNINKNTIHQAGLYLYRLSTSKGERITGKLIKN
jgi:hypothetical protein